MRKTQKAICCLMISGTIGGYIASVDALAGTSVVYFLIILCAGINFLVEFAINAVASPVIYRVVELVAGSRKAEDEVGEDKSLEDRKKSEGGSYEDGADRR